MTRVLVAYDMGWAGMRCDAGVGWGCGGFGGGGVAW